MTSILYEELYKKAYSLGRKHRHITAILYKNICCQWRVSSLLETLLVDL